MSLGLNLLRQEMDLLWGADLYGRPSPPPPLVAVAFASDGYEARFRHDAPAELRAVLVASLSRDPSPEALSLGGGEARTVWKSGPSYVFGGEAAFTPLRPELRIVTSQEEFWPSLVEARPRSWGDPEEWHDLLAGRLGPWAFGVVEGRVESVCYTPVASPEAAEAGIWTAPEERGRGYAPAVVAAWARVAAHRFGALFYSTGSENASSQAVARKLGLRSVGTIWQAW